MADGAARRPDDFALATGETHSILTLAFAVGGIDDWAPYVRRDPPFVRHVDCDDALRALEAAVGGRRGRRR